MINSLSSKSSLLALELHKFLRDLEPARRRSEFEDTARLKLNKIRQKIKNLLESCEFPKDDERFSRLQHRLQAIGQKIDKHRPRGKFKSSSQRREEWKQFLSHLQPAYASLAKCLDHIAIPVPKLRPTNYGRNVFHFAGGVMCLILLHHVFSSDTVGYVAVGCAIWIWLMEALKLRYEKVTKFYLFLLGKFAHPHEHLRINSATWFGTAIAILAVFFEPAAAAVGVAILCTADPVAAIIGRRYGRIPLMGGRTLEGSLGFLLSGTLISIIVLQIWHSYLSWSAVLLTAFIASLIGAIIELFSDRVDDNLTIPVGSALCAALVLSVIG